MQTMSKDTPEKDNWALDVFLRWLGERFPCYDRQQKH